VKFLRILKCGLVIFCLFLFLPSAKAQSAVPAPSQPTASQPAQSSGTVTGTVADSSGGAIPGATVTITFPDGSVRTATTDELGSYTLTGLPVGPCTVSISMQGFKTAAPQPLQVSASQKTPFDAILEVAEAAQSVSVVGQSTAAIETESSQISGTITQREITAIGLNGRNFTQLITLAPGVSNQTGQDEALVGVKGSVKYSVNGGRVEYNSFDVDGGDVLNAGINGSQSTLIVYPSLDAISNVQVLTSNYGAIYGRTASGTVLVTTKSGTNGFHGDAYEFLRNEAFNARNFFDETPKAPLYRRNDFGFTLGGPVYIPNHYNANKDKTFFFFSEEVREEKTPQQFNQAVPSDEERIGNFSDVCPFALPGQNGEPGQQVLFARSAYPDCPQASLASAAGKLLTFPGNQVPINSNAALILGTGIFPAPTSRSGCNSTIGSCYDATVSPHAYWREELFRIDQNITPSVRATFRYIHDEWSTITATPQWSYLQNSFPTIENSFTGPGISLLAHVSAVISPTFVNDFIASYTTDHIGLTDIDGPNATWQRPAGLTVGYLFNNGFGDKVPSVQVGGTNAAYGGYGFQVDSSFTPYHHTNPTYTFRDDLSKAIGKHTLEFGILVTFAQKNEINPPSGANTGDVQGLITFSNVSSFFSTGNAFADFLAGNVDTFSQDSAQNKYYNRYTVAEPYFQDDWRVTPRFTLNLGIRISLFGLWHEKYNNAYNWVQSAYNPAIAAGVDPLTGVLINPATGQPIPLNLQDLNPSIINGIEQCGVNGVPAGCMSGHPFNPAPRIGFAWDPKGDGKTAIRAGYGIFYHHGTGNEANTGSLEGSPPPVLTMTQFFPFGYECIGGVGAGCSGQGAYPINVTAIPTHVQWPYVQQWSLNLQHQLTNNLLASIAYVGSKGTHLTAERQINQLTPAPTNENPFLAGQPITAADCDTYDGSNITINGGTITSANPVFVNLEAACYGTPGKDFPNVNTLREFAPGIGRIYSLQNIANSNYNSLQFVLRRTAGPLHLDVAYTYSHSLDDSSDRFDSTFVNSDNLRENYASSNFDQRNLLNIAYVYDFSFYSMVHQFANTWKPHAPGSVAPATGWLHDLFDDWTYSGLTTYQTGTPFSVINGASGVNGVSVLDNAGVANGVGAGSYPDVVSFTGAPGPGNGNNPLSFGPILGNPNEFAAPQGLTFGNAGRNFLNNPSRLNFDMSLLKHFKTSESTSLEFRAEVFNVFNHPQFEIYDPNKGNTGSNTISCYGGPENLAGYQSTSSGGVDCLTGNSFLHPVDAHRPRTMQFGLKFFF
jgi:hypothetical protein